MATWEQTLWSSQGPPTAASSWLGTPNQKDAEIVERLLNELYTGLPSEGRLLPTSGLSITGIPDGLPYREESHAPGYATYNPSKQETQPITPVALPETPQTMTASAPNPYTVDDMLAARTRGMYGTEDIIPSVPGALPEVATAYAPAVQQQAAQPNTTSWLQDLITGVQSVLPQPSSAPVKSASDQYGLASAGVFDHIAQSGFGQDGNSFLSTNGYFYSKDPETGKWEQAGAYGRDYIPTYQETDPYTQSSDWWDQATGGTNNDAYRGYIS